VILDEAYCEFNLLEDPDSSIELLDSHPNLVLLRTFSKVYGLCGLRVGFALCGSEALPRAVDQVRQPFFCNALAQAAAIEALAHQDAVTERVTRTVAERIAVLLSAHDMNPLMPVMDRIIYVAAGRVAVGRTDEVVQPEVLSRLYGQHVDVIRVHGRVLVVAAPEGTDLTAEAFVKKLYHNVPVLDSGARGATVTFVERGIGDVLLAWENEAYLAVKELGPGKFDIVAPSLSIVAEPPVSLVDQYVDQHGTRKVAEEYLRYLYSKQGQEIAAKHFYRPRDPAVAAKYASQFQNIPLLLTVDAVFGGWTKAQATHFADHGTFDRIYDR